MVIINGAKALQDVAINMSTLKDAVKQRVQEAAFDAAAEAVNKGVVSQKCSSVTKCLDINGMMLLTY